MRLLLFPLLTLALALPALAVDGVLEINQTCALTGCFSGDAAGFPVTLSETGSYRLTGVLTLSDSDETGILVTADDVSIDLNGFGIQGPNQCTGGGAAGGSVGGGIGSTPYPKPDVGIEIQSGTADIYSGQTASDPARPLHRSVPQARSA